MMQLDIPRLLNDEIFTKLSKIWDSETNVEINIIPSLEAHELNGLVEFLLFRLPSEFAFSLLSSLAELDGIENRLLVDLFDKGDVACKVSVCLRDDLSDVLKEKCRLSEIDDVRGHFLSRSCL